jgi:hypothetical protein
MQNIIVLNAETVTFSTKPSMNFNFVLKIFKYNVNSLILNNEQHKPFSFLH